ncbi:MAG TPA: FKBP-type peptidyl-prolyl cis-trans isomerase [Lacunisphaera sp.]|nr:FKBP-type peptidyl-prolyl cis-trans isomerase [Lacunisphaera sp.]
MKRKPAAIPPASEKSVWMVIALASITLNAALLGWQALSAWRKVGPVQSATVPVAAPASPTNWSRELMPYAALGSFMAENNRIPDLKWTPAQFDAFQDGFRSSYEGRGLPLDEPASRLRDEINRRVQAMTEAERPDPVKDYFRFLKEKEGVKELPSGLHYRITEEGTGALPKPDDTVVISYAAGLPEGKTLPALSRTRAKVVVRDLLPGLAEGVQLLKVGGKGLIYVPASLSFKPADWPPQLPPGVPLVFFVEMHDIVPAP